MAVYPDRWQEVTHVDRRTVDKMLAPGQRVRQASIDSIFKDLGAQFDEDAHLAPYIVDPADPMQPVEGEAAADTLIDGEAHGRTAVSVEPALFYTPPKVAEGPSSRARRTGYAPVLIAAIAGVLIWGFFNHYSHRSPAPIAVSQGTQDPVAIDESDTNEPAPGGMELYDQFKADNALQPDLWMVNGPAGRAAMKKFESPSYTVVSPKISLDKESGLGISGITGNGQQGSIQSVRSFVPPFTVTALCNATAIHGDALRLAISGDNGDKGVGLGFGFSDGSGAGGDIGSFICTAPTKAGEPWQQVGDPLSPLPPATDIWYVLTIVVDAAGKATSAVSSGGFPIGKATTDVGKGPFYVVLSQEDGTAGAAGANQAYCGTIQVISEAEE